MTKKACLLKGEMIENNVYAIYRLDDAGQITSKKDDEVRIFIDFVLKEHRKESSIKTLAKD